MLKLPGTLSGLLCGLALTGCGWSGMFDKCEAQNGRGRSASFTLVDATGTTIPLALPRYHPDTVKLYFISPTRGRVPQGYSNGTGGFGIPVIRYDEPIVYGADYADTYLLYLSRTDQDTITLRYRLFEDDCNDADVDGIRIFFNGRDVFNGPRGVHVGEVPLPKR